jgi:hypothetical protein
MVVASSGWRIAAWRVGARWPQREQLFIQRLAYYGDGRAAGGEDGADWQLFGQVGLFGRFDPERLQFQTNCRFQGKSSMVGDKGRRERPPP